MSKSIKVFVLHRNDINSNLNIVKGVLNENGVNVKQCGKQVNISIYTATAKTFTANAWNTLATLPEGSRPTRVVNFALYDNTTSKQSTSTTIIGIVEATGAVSIWVYGDDTTLAPCGSCSFFAEQ